MKNYIIIGLTIFLSSCSHDDNRSVYGAPTPSLIGKWHQLSSTIDGVNIPYEDHEACGRDYIEFYGVNQIHSVDIFGCEPEIDWEGNYFLFGTQLSISNGTDSGTNTLVCKLEELTFTKLSFSYDVDENEDGVNEHHIDFFER